MRIWHLFLVISLGGCATHPVPTAQSPLVPSSRILIQQWLSQSPDTGTLIVKRDAGTSGAPCQVRLLVNAMPIADFAPKERIELHMPTGKYMLAARSLGLCAGGSVAEIAVTIASGTAETYRITSGIAGELSLQPTAF